MHGYLGITSALIVCPWACFAALRGLRHTGGLADVDARVLADIEGLLQLVARRQNSPLQRGRGLRERMCPQGTWARRVDLKKRRAAQVIS